MKKYFSFPKNKAFYLKINYLTAVGFHISPEKWAHQMVTLAVFLTSPHLYLPEVVVKIFFLM